MRDNSKLLSCLKIFLMIILIVNVRRANETYQCISEYTGACKVLQVAPLIEEVKLYLTEVEVECPDVQPPKPEEPDELTELFTCTTTLGDELTAALENPTEGRGGLCGLITEFRECLDSIPAGQRLKVITDEVDKLIPAVQWIWDKFCQQGLYNVGNINRPKNILLI